MGPRGARWCNLEVLKMCHSMSHENPPKSSPLSSSHASPVVGKLVQWTVPPPCC